MLNAGPQPVFSSVYLKNLMSTLAAKLLSGRQILQAPSRAQPDPADIIPDSLRCQVQANVTWQNCTRFPYPPDSAFAAPEGNVRWVCRHPFLTLIGRSMDVRSPAPYNEKNQSFGRNQ